MISLEISDNIDKKWNSRLIDSNLGTIYQTKEHGEYLFKINEKPKFLRFLSSNGQIIGQLLLSSSSRFKNKTNTSKFLNKIPISKKNLYRWTYGPLIFNSEHNSEIYSMLGEYFKKEKVKISGSEHPLSHSNTTLLKDHFKIVPWCSFLINLNESKETLYQNIDKHSGRKNIERSIKREVVIEEITDESFGDYIDLLNNERQSTGIELADKEQMYTWWKTFRPIGLSGFLAKKDEKLIGGMMFSFFNQYIIEGLVVRTSEDYLQKLYSQDLIKWKIIEWGVENKMNYYDLAGANPEPVSEKENGIIRYKKKWGGTKYNYHLIRN